MKKQKSNPLHKPDVGLLILRLTMAALFIPFGIMKFMDLNGIAGMVGGSMFIGFLVALAELGGGLMLLLGVGSRWGGAALGVVMIGAIFIAHNPLTMDGQLMNFLMRLIIGGVGFALFFTGSGKYALMKD